MQYACSSAAGRSVSLRLLLAFSCAVAHGASLLPTTGASSVARFLQHSSSSACGFYGADRATTSNVCYVADHAPAAFHAKSDAAAELHAASYAGNAHASSHAVIVRSRRHADQLVHAAGASRLFKLAKSAADDDG